MAQALARGRRGGVLPRLIVGYLPACALGISMAVLVTGGSILSVAALLAATLAVAAGCRLLRVMLTSARSVPRMTWPRPWPGMACSARRWGASSG